MYIKKINILSFRNIDNISAKLTPYFNIFYGDNGAGKTSILEAAYYLFTGKSFRSNLTTRIIQHDHPLFRITASICKSTDILSSHFVGMEKTRDGDRHLHLDQKTQSTIADITKLIPILSIGVDSYRFFSDGPKIRRSFLDWGLFHVEPSFLSTWQQFNKLLKQRNAALKLNQSQTDIAIWNEPYVAVSEQMDELRRAFITSFEPIYLDLFHRLLPNLSNSVTIRYKRGWSSTYKLADLLNERYFQDIAFGFTQSGPHRADFQVYINNIPAHDILSQGQQKLAAYALYLAQGILLHQKYDLTPVYLIDDLPSELDRKSKTLVLDILKQLNAQVLITCISSRDLSELTVEEGAQMFHVEHGSIHQREFIS